MFPDDAPKVFHQFTNLWPAPSILFGESLVERRRFAHVKFGDVILGKNLAPGSFKPVPDALAREAPVSVRNSDS